MSSPTASSRAPAADLSPEATSLLRALLLCELVSHMARTGDDRSASDANPGHLNGVEATRDPAGSPAAVAEVRDALRRLDNHEYGSCEACGRSIPLGRLEADPHARHCIACDAPNRGLVS